MPETETSLAVIGLVVGLADVLVGTKPYVFKLSEADCDVIPSAPIGISFNLGIVTMCLSRGLKSTL